MFVAVIALQAAGNAGADANATNVINVVAVNASGQPINGYHVMNRQASPNLAGCSDPSPAAVTQRHLHLRSARGGRRGVLAGVRVAVVPQ